MVEDLFLTDAFLIKGRLSGKYHRLRKVLEDAGRTFLTIKDATMIALRGNDVVRTPSVLVNTRELILAHELVDMAGDDMQRSLARNCKTTRIRAFYNGGVQLEIAGKTESGAYEPARTGGQRYFVVQEPVIRGLNLDGSAELKLLRSLSYAIIQKDRLAYVYDFS